MMTKTIPPALDIEALALTIGGTRVLNGVNLRLQQGERVALLGESGAGKSMTARAALGLLPPEAALQGSVHIAGIDVTRIPAIARPAHARAAMVMQDTLAALSPITSIGRQLEQPLKSNGYRGRAAKTRALALLADVGIPAPQSAYHLCPPELSGGQRQRVCIAIALACAAPVIIADEATSALDVITQAQILKLICRLSEAPNGPAVLFITHDLHAAAHLCQRALVIEAGRIVEDAPMQRLLQDPQHRQSRHLILASAQCGIACERLYA